MAGVRDPLPIGSQIGEFVVVRVLGAGGFGVTYEAHERRLDRKVAIKEYFPEDCAVRAEGGTVEASSSSREVTARFRDGRAKFLAEARTLARIDHPNVVKVITFLEANETAYIVMEFVSGTPLADQINAEGPFDEDRTFTTLMPLLDAVEAIHGVGLIHRDIKPDNILIKNPGIPVLIDFGTAKLQTTDRSKTLNPVLTPGYAPIEQYSATAEQGPWTDVYALAAVAYTCMTGLTPPDAFDRVPDDGLLPFDRDLRVRMSRSFADSLAWGLAPFAQDRPQSIGEWRDALLGRKVPRIRSNSRRSAQAQRPGANPGGNSGHSSARPAIVTPGARADAAKGRIGLYAFIASGAIAAALAATFLPSDVVNQASQFIAAQFVQLSPAEIVEDDNDFQTAQAIGVSEAFLVYLKRHPYGRHRHEAKQAAQNPQS
jgi:serine/threonine protein kinase